MDKFIDSLTSISMLTLIVFFAAILQGTILWMLYHNIHYLFPNAAANGIIAAHLSWWQSVCIVWLFGILFKSPTQLNSK